MRCEIVHCLCGCKTKLVRFDRHALHVLLLRVCIVAFSCYTFFDALGVRVSISAYSLNCAVQALAGANWRCHVKSQSHEIGHTARRACSKYQSLLYMFTVFLVNLQNDVILNCTRRCTGEFRCSYKVACVQVHTCKSTLVPSSKQLMFMYKIVFNL